jgi:hypothetical protein
METNPNYSTAILETNPYCSTDIEETKPNCITGTEEKKPRYTTAQCRRTETENTVAYSIVARQRPHNNLYIG